MNTKPNTLNMSARNVAITNYNIDIVTPDADQTHTHIKNECNRAKRQTEEEQEELK